MLSFSYVWAVKYLFDDFELDTTRAELRWAGRDVAIEPKTYALLCLLVGSHDRLVTKDEIIETIWDGRVVSDSVISTAIKLVRRALGDDGDIQAFVKTIRGRGFRFVGTVKLVSAGQAGQPPQVQRGDKPGGGEEGSKPSIAILPFKLVGYAEKYSAIADAVPSELISSLSRLRWLTVVARGSSFRFRGPQTEISSVHDLLGAKYCLSGSVEIFGSNLTVSVELSDTRTEAVVWSERFPAKIDDIHDVRAQIVASTTSAMELHIPLQEATKARLLAPDSLDAWSIYHLGLQHMFRFNRVDSNIAAAHFERATELDPYFARAFAARSFTSFQKAFLKNSSDVERDKRQARQFAEKSLELDPVDPFGNFTLGRSFWLAGDLDAAIEWLERAVTLSPNFAQGHYARGWTDVIAGRGSAALKNLGKAIELSPLDPFLYGMQSARGMAYVHEGDFASAAFWADKGARAPGAHFLIAAIAAAAHSMNGDQDRAKYWMDNVHDRRDDASLEHFFTAFPFQNTQLREDWERALVKSGL